MKVTIFNTPLFYLADTCIETDQYLNPEDSSTDYPIYYIGQKSDTIKIGRRYWEGRTPWPENFEYHWPWNRQYSEKILNIYVDTSSKTNSPIEYLSRDCKIIDDSTLNYHSFLFAIRNISDSVLYMGETFSVFFLHREAKNKSGEWVKIDRKLSEDIFCGTNQPLIFLKPNEIIISKVKRYKGSFFTDFRLVFGFEDNIVYSNIFKDYIDEKMFRSITHS